MTKADKEGQRKTPILRFKGFTDDWEQRKLGNIFEKLNERNKNLEFNDSKTISIATMKYNPQGNGAKKLDGYKVLRKGDVAFEGHSNKKFKFGRFVLNDLDDGIISPRFAAIRPIDKINIFFWKYYIHSEKVMRNILIHSTKRGTMMNELVYSDFFKQSILVPTNTEQNKVGIILNLVSNLLALYERKTRLLGKVRTFLTQRLFSNSSKVSLYFDNKNWSEHKISEFLTERNEKVVPNSSIPLVSFTVEKGVTPKSKRYNREFLVKDDNKKYKITKKDDIVYNPANLKFGAIARNKFGNAAFSPIYVTFITKLNPAFTEFLVCRKDFINLALKYQEGTVYERMAVKSKDFLNLKIYLPNSSRDINHIAQILQSLDTLVSLNKNKVSLITLIKKELLNTMFI